jgi:hypothetical protein
VTAALAFDPAAERSRFEARLPLLRRHWDMALEPITGVRFQPETSESVEDQVRETLWSEGVDPATAPAQDLGDARRSFAVLSPRRESQGRSIAATLSLAFPEAERTARFEALGGLPEALWLELADGALVGPEVDGGAGSEGGRVPAVLALRYRLPDGARPVALVGRHAEVQGRWAAPASWADWA